MRRLPAPRHLAPPRRPAALAAAAACALGAALGAACGTTDRTCPGVEIGTLALQGSLTAAACAGSGAAPAYPATVKLSATFALAGAGPGAALCTASPRAAPFVGSHAAVAGGDQVDVALETAGAVLAACGGGCGVTVRQVVSGVVTRDPGSGLATGFTGTLTETETADAAASCPSCTLPCQATWALATAP